MIIEFRVIDVRCDAMRVERATVCARASRARNVVGQQKNGFHRTTSVWTVPGDAEIIVLVGCDRSGPIGSVSENVRASVCGAA